MIYSERYLKIVQNTSSRKTASGIWKILKYFKPVSLQNTTYRSCYYLFVIEADKFSVNALETFISFRFRRKKWLAFFFFFLKTSNENYWRKTTWNSSMKVIFKARFCGLCSGGNGTSKLLTLFHCCFVEKHPQQLRNLSSSDSHESCGQLFGRLESLFGCAEWANCKALNGNSEPVGRQDSWRWMRSVAVLLRHLPPSLLVNARLSWPRAIDILSYWSLTSVSCTTLRISQ